MIAHKTPLDGVIVLECPLLEDERGGKHCDYSERELSQLGISFQLSEQYVYEPVKAGTLYGIHFQTREAPQQKLMLVTRGRGMDYAVDLRKGSPDYLKWTGVELNAENRLMQLIPAGFGHAFLSLEDDTRVVMRIDAPFDRRYGRVLKWDEQAIGIDYPVTKPTLAAHDVHAPGLGDCDVGW